MGTTQMILARGSLCMSVLPNVHSNFCSLGGGFCLKKRVRLGTNRPPKQARSRNRPPAFTFLKYLVIKAMNSRLQGPPLPAQPRYPDRVVHLSRIQYRLIAVLSCA
jgi:hypothetical protein